jgi:tetratricopeptide (TPR) repeat protein
LADADRAACPRCGAPILSDHPASVCPRCLLSDAQRGQSEHRAVSRSFPGSAGRKLALALASALAFMGATLSGGVWFGNWRKQQPADAIARYNRGVGLQAQGKLKEAIAEYRAAIRIMPDYVEAHSNLGNALRAQGKTAEAVDAYRAAIRINPSYGELHNNLASAVADQGRLEEAIAEVRRAVRLKPEDALAHNNLGLGLLQQGKLEEAAAEFRTAIELKPDYAEAHNGLGLALRADGKLDAALAAWREAIRLKPDFASAHNSLASALVLSPKQPRRDYDEGLQHARQAVALAPGDPASITTLALAEYRSGHWSESVAAAEQATGMRDGGDADDWFILALAHWQRGERGEARRWFEQAVTGIRQHASEAAGLRPLWTEAAESLGERGPGAAGAGSPATPAAEKPR